MALSSSLVRVAVTGGVYAGLSTPATLPTNATADLAGGLVEVGYLTEDGVTQAINADVTDLKAWQNGDIVRKIQTSHDVTYALTLFETNATTLEVYYGNYDGDGVQIRGDQLPRMPWVIDVLDGEHKLRLVIPDGQVTERGEVTYRNDAGITYPVTITAYPDASGNKAYLYQAVDAPEAPEDPPEGD